MSREKKKKKDQKWDDLPKNRVIVMENSASVKTSDTASTSTSSDEENILLKSITSHFTFDSENLPAGKLLVYRGVSNNYFTFYMETSRECNSPWKGMHSYIPGKPILQTNPDTEDPLILLLTKISKDPRLLALAGVSLQYESLPTNQIQVHFYLHHSRIYDSIVDFIPKMLETFKLKIQNLFRDILDDARVLTEIEFNGNNNIYQKERRQEDLNFERFFELCSIYRQKYASVTPKYEINEDDLNCSLMPYQKNTVRWMINREANTTVDENFSWMMKCQKLSSDSSLIYYPLMGAVTRNKLTPENQYDLAKVYTSKGGILADEMGLGKTIQVLALIATHKQGCELQIEYDEDEMEVQRINKFSNNCIAEQIRLAEATYIEMKNAKQVHKMVAYNLKEFTEGDTIFCTQCSKMCSMKICGWNTEQCDNEPFYCPKCLTRRGNRRSLRTTLIILPESLILQWFTEISKHCSDSIKVLFYFGVKKHGYLQPYEMESYDIILTTYDTLRTEINYTENKGPRRNLRNGLKPLFLHSSLIHVKFWRVVVDESQMMPQGMNSQLSKMLMKIHADNWWCVTGTPLVKTVSDICPLFNFLNVFPFGNPDFFSQYVHPQYINFVLRLRYQNESIDSNNLPHIFLLEILARIMSRNTKTSINLKLPQLTETEKIICFTEVEERQYKEEKERLKNIVDKAIGRADNNSLLSDLPCRDKVLQELKCLRQTILIGQKQASDIGSVPCVLAPETVVFRLIHNKKIAIKSNFRNFLNFSLGLAGVQILMNQPQNALDSYKYAIENYDELLSTEKITEDIKNYLDEQGANYPRSIFTFEDEETKTDALIADDSTIPLEEENVSENKKNSEEKTRGVASFLRGIQQLLKKYAKSNFDEVVVEQASPSGAEEYLKKDKNLPGPPDPKKPRLEIKEKPESDLKSEIVDNVNHIVPDTADHDTNNDKPQSEVERQIHIRKLALAAIEPISIDATQEVHLIMNMFTVQTLLNVPKEERIPLDRLKEVFTHYFKLEMRAIEKICHDLPVFTTIWNDDNKNLIYEIRQFFEMIQAQCAILKDTGALYEHGKVIRDNVKKNILPHLPFIALYDTQILTPTTRPHRVKRCMGGCMRDILECEMFYGQPCLSLAEVIKKTINHIERIDEKRKKIDEKLSTLIQFIMKMADPDVLVTLFTQSSENFASEFEKMNNVLLCEHSFIKGTLDEKELVDQYYTKDNKCVLCDTWCKLFSFQFESGYSSYHGVQRQKSGVLDFAVYLVDHFSPGKKEAYTFGRRFLRPFFEKIQDVLKAYRLAIMVLVEITDRFHELSQAKTRITDAQVLSFFERMPAYSEPTIEMKRCNYEEHHKAERNSVIKIIRKDAKELRYLMNLMSKQLTGESDENSECPICQAQQERFMIFTCGHRVCQECFNRLKIIHRGSSGASVEVATCPSCRVVNNSQQVMMAQCGKYNEEHETVIPGIILSAKMSAAIKLMRQILASNSANKIILFTSVDQSSTKVWNYLIEIMELAKIPYSATTRSTCGKKVLDFEMSQDIKVLLCPLSLCANGLNMTGANYIIFLDPPHLQSVLQQAIGRINRFGQKRSMHIFHLLVEGSLDVELRETAKKTHEREDEQKGWSIGDIRSMFDINFNRQSPVPELADADHAPEVIADRRIVREPTPDDGPVNEEYLIALRRILPQLTDAQHARIERLVRMEHLETFEALDRLFGRRRNI